MPPRLLWRTDVHLSDHTPVSRTDNWREAVLRKLKFVGDCARDRGVHAVLDGGDFFDIKNPSRNSHSLVRETADIHSQYPCPTYANVGNHDCVYGNIQYLPQQPLGVLFSTGVFKRCYDQHEAFFTQDGINVRVVGVPYHGVRYDLDRFRSIKKGSEDYLVVMGHILASPQGGEMFEGEDILKYSEVDSFDGDAFCFLPGTLVTTNTGRSVAIETLGVGDTLLGSEGLSTRVDAVHPSREVDEDVVCLDVEGIPMGVMMPGVTVEHPFWVARGMTCRIPCRADRRCHPDKPKDHYPCSNCYDDPGVYPEWVKSGDIREGDYLAIPYPEAYANDSIGREKARLLGYYLSEGHIIYCRGRVAGIGISLHEDETEIISDIERLSASEFGRKIHVRKNTGRGVAVSIYGKEIGDFCLSHGGSLAESKSIDVSQYSREERAQILLGWIRGDGHARNPYMTKRVRAEVISCTVSPHLATQMYLLSLSLGLRPSHTIRPPKKSQFPNYVSTCLRAHIISFYGDDAEFLADAMGLPIPGRAKTKISGFFHDGMYWARVRKVSRKHYCGPVHNIRTLTQDYVAGHVLTHNCFGHWHKDQGVFTTPKGKSIVNAGSLTRGALSQDNLDRKPKVVFMEFTQRGITIEEIPVPCGDSSVVFDLHRKQQETIREESFEGFADTLKSFSKKTGKKDLRDRVRELPLEFDVREGTLSYLEKRIVP